MSPSPAPLTTTQTHRRFLVLAALRWLPTGFLVPVFVLLPLDRGLSLSQIGIAASLQGFVVFGLELPTGGLADTVGRRVVLVGAMLVSLVSTGLLLVADTFWLLALVFALQGVYRALDSGPLEAWYVDTAQAADPQARIDRGLSHYGAVLGVAIAAGAISAGGVVALDPWDGVNPLVLPVAGALVVQVVCLLAIVALMREAPRHSDGTTLRQAVRETPRTVLAGVRLLRGSHVLLALVLVEVCWGFGSATYESLFPVRLSEVLGSEDAAATLTGPAASLAWLAHAGGAAVTPWFARRLGVAPAAALGRVVQGVSVALMGMLGGVAGIVVAYLAAYVVHGSSNATHATLLHRQATGEVRATVLSLNSMLAQPAGSLGLILLTSLAEGVSVGAAMVVGGLVLAAAAPLYLPAWRQERAHAEPVPDEPVVGGEADAERSEPAGAPRQG